MGDEKYSFKSDWVKKFETELCKQYNAICDKVYNNETNINSQIIVDVSIPFEHREEIWEFIEDITYDYQVELNKTMEIDNGIRYIFNVIMEEI